VGAAAARLPGAAEAVPVEVAGAVPEIQVSGLRAARDTVLAAVTIAAAPAAPAGPAADPGPGVG